LIHPAGDRIGLAALFYHPCLSGPTGFSVIWVMDQGTHNLNYLATEAGVYALMSEDQRSTLDMLEPLNPKNAITFGTPLT
jgi:hypothetical protein